MKRQPRNASRPQTLRGGAVALAIAAGLHADGAVTPNAPTANAPSTAASSAEAEPGTLDSLFNGKLPDAIGKSKISVNVRLRYEHADQQGLDASDAFTLRTRFGLTTAPLYGFQGMIEGEDVSVLGDLDNAFYPGEPANGKTTVADPPTTEINQAWVSYGNTNWHATVKGGRQRIILDDARFVGDVGWRQNQQTFDAVTLAAAPVEDLNLFYGWVGRVNRVFGNVSGLPAGLKDFKSDSHLLNVSYSACDYANVTAYTYLLDLSNGAGDNASSASYGLTLAGKLKASDKITLNYRGAFAWQTDYADSTLDYGAPYYHLEAGATIKPVTFGVGYEVLGSDDNDGVAGGRAAFSTPLATLHAFNGWADVFLNTPADGLRDFYAFAQVTLPKVNMPLRVVYHKFDADSGGADFGQEIDVLLSKQLGKHWTALAKYAHYEAEDASPPAQAAPADVDKFSVELSFIF